MKAHILLEDGTVLTGKAFGDTKTVLGEIVFNTSMAGYQETLTDPSYAGQIVVMTYPLIGNYGVNDHDVESDKVQVSGFVVKENAKFESNWMSQGNLSDYLKEQGVFAISDIDTRMLTKKIRNQGSMNCLLTTEEITDELREQLKNYTFPKNTVEQVSTREIKHVPGKGKHIGIVDLGLKKGILKCIEQLGCSITIFPWDTPYDTLLNYNLDAILLSNGPGDPKDVTLAIHTAEHLLGKIPLFGICLGQQILALALGGDTYKLKFGHRGGNHPVLDLRTNKILITSQNHGYAIDGNKVTKDIEITHINVNDLTVEGFCNKELKVYAVQFHPEAGPGPSDANVIFKEWITLLDEEGDNA
ncbi:MAG: carbamoyl-phosphate synthase small subunit [Epulopiscium sp.]|jgi:carbamoyl-phosphate synthase small subunit|uniref:Carbamoyl phosphate synthase small chain n=1 Tax=Defluviitalea raffinosedens TaxID=1450156 RepID=A0A7C8LMQ4_9FIRM|nr:glutamine-hydrolyzing carbamoyl-phosphate synthase small subunit [Defluviitalea raffinosedens]MBZ4669112.1 pyrAA [Defluviitaleaceae bacterium]MDK2789073.1 carbamoyl-phosphate synthase small subunit [Candidatus Epulonipiscium sp.]KAE9637323.1 glutamine-hydrolyzing carbamoyl-phosphate synthase small subunit [Defluviitalea raffinosedens]MBM7685630.1 carbamoyl-phosphate synthase small subunit [Defluviitalea raffinosedens]HHW66641.1 glutamine-hydrolyzing carbamoyl-phosphate synthase small subuni